ncbi:MAG: hypothetical protein V1901_04090 [Patescibacteria group bacterium]
MKADIKNNLIYCKKCREWKLAGIETFLPDGMEGRVACMKEEYKLIYNSDEEQILVVKHLLGYTWDKEWQLIFPIIKIKNQENWDE